MGNPVNDKAYYHYARSLGLCGRCKRADALPGMAYCLKCRTDMQHYNHARKGLPSKRKVYVTKFTVAMKDAGEHCQQ